MQCGSEHFWALYSAMIYFSLKRAIASFENCQLTKWKRMGGRHIETGGRRWPVLAFPVMDAIQP